MAGREGRTVRQREWKPRRERREEWRSDWHAWQKRDTDPHGYKLLAYALLAFVFWFGFVGGCTVAAWVL